jgi:SAM-dependent methyltransferase
VNGAPPLPALPAAERWAELLGGWTIPAAILDQAPVSPWTHDVERFATDESLDRDGVSSRWAREVLPPVGGTVLDVGCGGGRSSLPLVPPANELIGVDTHPAMLERFTAAAASVGVARRTVCGSWPEVAAEVPVADVVVCERVVYGVHDIAPFLLALTDHARLAVVVELTTVHPMSAWSAAWQHFWGVERPTGPTADDLLAVVRELGLDPEHTTSGRPVRADPAGLVRTARRRLCLTAERDAELATWLAEHPPRWPETSMTIRWPGAAAA